MAKPQQAAQAILHTVTLDLTQDQVDAVLAAAGWRAEVEATRPDGETILAPNPVTQGDALKAYYAKHTDAAEAQQDRMLGKQAMQEFIEQRRRARKRRREG